MKNSSKTFPDGLHPMKDFPATLKEAHSMFLRDISSDKAKKGRSGKRTSTVTVLFHQGLNPKKNAK